MNKLAKLIAAVHATVLTSSGFVTVAHAQDATEVQAYTAAVTAGTPEAIAAFLAAYPASSLPGSALGAQIAATVGQPTAAVSAPATTSSASKSGGSASHDSRNGGDSRAGFELRGPDGQRDQANSIY